MNGGDTVIFDPVAVDDENRCPYCGSKETNIMVPTYASCHTENGRLVTELYEIPKDVPYTEMFGCCNNCGARYSVKEINEKGAIFETTKL